MRLVVQRVNFAKVLVGERVVGKIDKGILVYLGISRSFCDDKLDWMVDKILKLRLWGSDKKGFDLNVRDIGGEILVVSEFTLFGDCKRGTKPNFANSGDYDFAKKYYEEFIEKLKYSGVNVESGEFGSMMRVVSENDGPVTLLLEK